MSQAMTSLRHLLLVADARSPHTVGWCIGTSAIFDQVTLLNSTPAPAYAADLDGAVDIVEGQHVMSMLRQHMLPVVKGRFPDTVAAESRWRWSGASLRQSFEYLGAARLASHISTLSAKVNASHIHALRLPWEGIAVARARLTAPRSVSLWGSDLLTQAPASPVLSRAAKKALQSMDGLTADCARDVQLALERGLRRTVPTAVLPGDMGLDDAWLQHARVDPGARPLVVTCPRRPGPHIRWRQTLDALTQVRSEGLALEIHWLDCANTQLGAEAARRRLSVEVHGRLSREELLTLAGRTHVVISPSVSDGVPNSVLQFMARGAVPAVGRLASLEEFLVAERNASLFDPGSVGDIAAALRWSADTSTLTRARVINDAILTERFLHSAAARAAAAFYETLPTSSVYRSATN